MKKKLAIVWAILALAALVFVTTDSIIKIIDIKKINIEETTLYSSYVKQEMEQDLLSSQNATAQRLFLENPRLNLLSLNNAGRRSDFYRMEKSNGTFSVEKVEIFNQPHYEFNPAFETSIQTDLEGDSYDNITGIYTILGKEDVFPILKTIFIWLILMIITTGILLIIMPYIPESDGQTPNTPNKSKKNSSRPKKVTTSTSSQKKSKVDENKGKKDSNSFNLNDLDSSPESLSLKDESDALDFSEIKESSFSDQDEFDMPDLEDSVSLDQDEFDMPDLEDSVSLDQDEFDMPDLEDSVSLDQDEFDMPDLEDSVSLDQDEFDMPDLEDSVSLDPNNINMPETKNPLTNDPENYDILKFEEEDLEDFQEDPILSSGSFDNIEDEFDEIDESYIIPSEEEIIKKNLESINQVLDQDPALIPSQNDFNQRLENLLKEETSKDFVLGFIKIHQMDLADRIKETALTFFQKESVFSFGKDGLGIILPSFDLKQGIEEFKGLVQSCSTADIKTDQYSIGLSSRNTRKITTNIIKKEAASAVKKADNHHPVIGFQSDPNKYKA